MTAHRFARDAVAMEPWPSERPRFVLSLVISLGIWLLAIITRLRRDRYVVHSVEQRAEWDAWRWG